MSAAAFALVAVAACEWPAEPEPEASRVRVAGTDEQPVGEVLGEDPHMVALAREIPGFGGYWWEHESATAPGTAGTDHRPDRGRLVIALTEAGAGSFAAARRTVLSRRAAEITRAPSSLSQVSELPEPPPEVVERVVAYSFIELARHRARLRALFAVDEVVSLAVDEEFNRVVIGLEDPAAKAAVLALVTELAVPVEVISFSQEKRVKMLGLSSGESPPHPITLGGAGRLDKSIPDGRLRGGYQVEAEGGKKCTLGFTAVLDNGGLVFFSNSHCSRIPWQTDFGGWGQPDSSSLVGVEVGDPPVRRCWKRWGGIIPIRVDCRDSDASMIAVNTGVSIALGEIGRTRKRHQDCTLGLPSSVDYCDIFIDPENPALFITYTRYSSDKGDVLDKIGHASGWTSGSVTETCKDVRGDTGVVVECADEVDFSVTWGDSGGPVFKYLGSGSVQFRGIVFGMKDSIRGWNGVHEKGYFQDLEQIQWDHETLTVIDPGVPWVRIVGSSLVQPEEECTWTTSTWGLRPLTYEWSGVLHGSGSKITGVVEESGWLRVKVTDPLDRTASDSLEVTVGDWSCVDDDDPDDTLFSLPPGS